MTWGTVGHSLGPGEGEKLTGMDGQCPVGQLTIGETQLFFDLAETNLMATALTGKSRETCGARADDQSAVRDDGTGVGGGIGEVSGQSKCFGEGAAGPCRSKVCWWHRGWRSATH